MTEAMYKNDEIARLEKKLEKAKNKVVKLSVDLTELTIQHHQLNVDTWRNVAVDTPILVLHSDPGSKWLPRYFAKFENGKVYFWSQGKTSRSAAKSRNIVSWDNVRLDPSAIAILNWIESDGTTMPLWEGYIVVVCEADKDNSSLLFGKPQNFSWKKDNPNPIIRYAILTRT